MKLYIYLILRNVLLTHAFSYYANYISVWYIFIVVNSTKQKFSPNYSVLIYQ